MKFKEAKLELHRDKAGWRWVSNYGGIIGIRSDTYKTKAEAVKHKPS